MRGNGRGKTAIVWSQSSSDNIASATFKAEASDFIAFGISFKVNTFYMLKKLYCNFFFWAVFSYINIWKQTIYQKQYVNFVIYPLILLLH